MFRAIGINFVGGIWTGVLIVSTTPIFVSALGFEGFGLIGFWQLLLLVSVIFDFGLGASLVREFARYNGNNEPKFKYIELLLALQPFYVLMSALVAAAIYFSANWLTNSWLKLTFISTADASLIIKLMGGAIALQFISTLYSNGLAGLQQHGAMNSFQIFGNTLKYLGGVVVLLIFNNLIIFFIYQLFAALLVCLLTRRYLLGQMGKIKTHHLSKLDFSHIYKLSKYSTGMFMTALCGLLLANIDRIVLSKFVHAEDFGRYTLAFTGAGLLQMVILAFYRSYFPKFSELKAIGDEGELKKIYFQGCRYLGAVIVPSAIAACVFASDLFRIWMGSADETVVAVFRLMIIATTCSGLMWLPAALQQAVGWTRLHISLMTLALFLGLPLLIFGIKAFGTIGATVMMLLHGLIEITLGLWLMNRVLYPRDNLRWYFFVVMSPLMAAVPVVVLSVLYMPNGMERIESFVWVVATGVIMLFAAVVLQRRLSN